MAAASYSVQIVVERETGVHLRHDEVSVPTPRLHSYESNSFSFGGIYNVPRVERAWTVTVTVTVKGDRVQAVIPGVSTSGWGSDAPHDVTGMCRVVGYR